MISIIVPVYNVEKYLEKCICSILDQTYRDFELILVDDGSRDKSGGICDAYKKKDGRIRVFHQENKGLSGARNAGLARASGEYITYIDSDDSVDPHYLEVLFENAQKYGAEVSVCGYRSVWEDRGRKSRPEKVKTSVRICTGREAVYKIVAENDRKMITAWGKLYHARLKPLLEYPQGRTHEDEFVTYRVLYIADKVVISPQALYGYLQRGDSIMNSSYSERRLDKIRALEEAVDYFRKEGDKELERYAEKRYLLQLSIAWYRVSVFLPERKDLTARLREEWLAGYRAYRENIKDAAKMTDRAALKIYRASPRMYGVIAGIFEKIFREV